MPTNKKSIAASRSVQLVLPASVGSTSAKSKKSKSKNKSSTTVVPAAYGPHVQVGRPNFSTVPGSDGRVRVRHREFVADVPGSVAYAISSYSVNPGQATTFPWLNAIARCYETYVFHSLRFEYMPAVGTSVSGVVTLAVDYDAADPGPSSKVELLQMHGAVRGSPWDYTTLVCDKPDLNKLPQHFTRKAQWVAGAGDIKTYDVGNLFVSTMGMLSAATVGELYVTYDIELRTPQPVIFVPEEYSATKTATTATGATKAKPFGTLEMDENPAWDYIAATGTFIAKKVGSYMLSTIIQMDDITAGTITFNAETTRTITSLGTATNASGYLENLYYIVVHTIGANVIPTVAAAGATVITSQFRSAPYKY
jgi:hypothetical protein